VTAAPFQRQAVTAVGVREAVGGG